MAIALREIESVQIETSVETDLQLVVNNSDKWGGFLVARLISEKRGQNRNEEIASIAKKLSLYEGILPDPFNNSKRLKITRLIATIDSGMYNNK